MASLLSEQGCGWCRNGWVRPSVGEPTYLYSLREPYNVQVYCCSRCGTWWEWNPWVQPRIMTREAVDVGVEYRFDMQDNQEES